MQRQRIAALTQLGDNIFTSKSENNNIYNIQPQANGRSCFTRLPRQRRAQLQRLHRQGWVSFLHTSNQHLFQFETLSYSLQLYNGEKLPDTEGVVVKQGPQQNPFADSEFFLFVRKNCLLKNYLIDLQNLSKLCGR